MQFRHNRRRGNSSSTLGSARLLSMLRFAEKCIDIIFLRFRSLQNSISLECPPFSQRPRERAEVMAAPELQSVGRPFQIPSIYDRPSTADLNGLPAPAMRSMHAPLNHIAIAVVIVRIVVAVVVIIVVRVAAAVAESEAVPERSWNPSRSWNPRPSSNPPAKPRPWKPSPRNPPAMPPWKPPRAAPD
jgi:hypothetical protein